MTGPNLGDIIYLTTCVVKMDVEAVTTMPDTPNQYSGNLNILSDQGNMDLTQIIGPTGDPGVANFQLRRQYDVSITLTSQLPAGLTNTSADIGKYWLINSYDQWGHIDDVTAWVWWGTGWRSFMMGTFGPPGPTPQLSLSMELIPPTEDSYIDPSGSATNPSWQFNIAVPHGISGPASAMALFPDVDEFTHAPAQFSIMAFGGDYDSLNEPLWAPVLFNQGAIAPFSVPTSAFKSYTGASQQAAVGQFELPPQPYPWTPVVWGHIGGNGIQLSSSPFMIGCEVLLGDATAGTQISRGVGTTGGFVNIFPHYSTNTDSSAAITPINQRALIPANHTDPTQATLYINLWNDGQLGIYTFDPTDAQLFVMVVPVNPPFASITTPG